MARIIMDIEKIITNGEELKKIANDYNKLIDETYNKLLKINENGIFMSEKENGAANLFIKCAEADKKNVLQVGADMHQLGNNLINYANRIKSVSNDTIED